MKTAATGREARRTDRPTARGRSRRSKVGPIILRRSICRLYSRLLSKEGQYSWSGGKSVSVFDSTIVRVETDAGFVGHGESCPLGPVYLSSYAGGVRAGLAELAPHLIGADPTQLGPFNQLMDARLKGHPYVKSALDVACWDILGQAAGVPVSTLLGGRYGDAVTLYRAISKDSPDNMAGKVATYRAEGYTRFQLKVGDDPDLDIERIRAVAARLRPGERLVADANTVWLQHEALRVIRGVRDIDVYIEQPCLTYEECLAVRARCDHPFVLDEVIGDLPTLLRAASDVDGYQNARHSGCRRVCMCDGLWPIRALIFWS